MKLLKDTRPEWAKRLGVGFVLVCSRRDQAQAYLAPKPDLSALEFGTIRTLYARPTLSRALSAYPSLGGLVACSAPPLPMESEMVPLNRTKAAVMFSGFLFFLLALAAAISARDPFGSLIAASVLIGLGVALCGEIADWRNQRGDYYRSSGWKYRHPDQRR